MIPAYVIGHVVRAMVSTFARSVNSAGLIVVRPATPCTPMQVLRPLHSVKLLDGNCYDAPRPFVRSWVRPTTVTTMPPTTSHHGSARDRVALLPLVGVQPDALQDGRVLQSHRHAERAEPLHPLELAQVQLFHLAGQVAQGLQEFD